MAPTCSGRSSPGCLTSAATECLPHVESARLPELDSKDQERRWFASFMNKAQNWNQWPEGIHVCCNNQKSQKRAQNIHTTSHENYVRSSVLFSFISNLTLPTSTSPFVS